MKHIAKIAICTTVLTALLSESAQAAFTLVKRMSSADDRVVVGEFADQFGDVGYEVDVASGIFVHILIVSHNEPFGGPSAPSGWSSFNVSKDNWDTEIFAGRTGAQIGSFESLFREVDTNVAVYIAPDVSPQALSDTNIDPDLEDVEESLWIPPSFVPRFRRGGGTATEFVALDLNGMIIGQSVPEPSATLLILSGSMVFLRRRR